MKLLPKRNVENYKTAPGAGGWVVQTLSYSRSVPSLHTPDASSRAPKPLTLGTTDCKLRGSCYPLKFTNSLEQLKFRSALYLQLLFILKNIDQDQLKEGTHRAQSERIPNTIRLCLRMCHPSSTSLCVTNQKGTRVSASSVFPVLVLHTPE